MNSFFQTYQDVDSLTINNTNFSRICYKKDRNDNSWIDFYRAHARTNVNYWFLDPEGIGYELGFGVDTKDKRVKYFCVGYPEGDMEGLPPAADNVEFFYDAYRPIKDRFDYEFYWYNLKREKDHLREALLKYF